MNRNDKRFSNQIEYVMDKLEPIDRLAMLAEEASELAHAALKLARIMKGNNPTPVKFEDAYYNLVEEITDVELSIKLVGVSNDEKLERQKLERCVARLKEKSNENLSDKGLNYNDI